jgi:hypothetical protein
VIKPACKLAVPEGDSPEKIRVEREQDNVKIARRDTSKTLFMLTFRLISHSVKFVCHIDPFSEGGMGV